MNDCCSTGGTSRLKARQALLGGVQALTACGAVARGSRCNGHVGAFTGGVVSVSCVVCPQEGCAQDDRVVRRPRLDAQHTGCTGDLHQVDKILGQILHGKPALKTAACSVRLPSLCCFADISPFRPGMAGNALGLEVPTGHCYSKHVSCSAMELL